MGEKYSFGSCAVAGDRTAADFFILRLFFIVRNTEDDAIMTVMGDEICKRRDYR